MRRRNSSALIAIFSAVILLAGCSGDNDTSDLQRYVDGLKKNPSKNANLLQQFHWQQESSYSGQNLRSPFPQQAASADSKQLTLLPLERYPLDALHLVGIVQENNALYGVLLAPDGKIYPTRIGDRIGSQQGKVVEINEREVIIDEPVHFESGELSEHKVSLRLKDK